MNLLHTLLSSETLLRALPQISVFAVLAAGKLGLIMPLIVSFLSQPKFTKAQRTALSVASCLAASAIVCLATGAFTGINWAASLVVLLGITWSLYARFYKPSGIAPWFEQATELSKMVPVLLAIFGAKATGALSAAQTQADAIETSGSTNAASDPAPVAGADNAEDGDAQTPDAPTPAP